ncbi:MAG: glycosyltransferase family 2 protein [Lachnospiraceae bacterium]|nr:glycosyltransferase family 2 protein [Lachnospiraceae bacterium]
MDNTDIDTEWVLRLDADEFLTKELRWEIGEKLDSLPNRVTGVELRRRIIFMGRWIKHGGIYPTILLRIFRKNAGRCEQTIMDEHIVLDHGKVVRFKNDFVNDDIKSLSWWIKKHDWYADREVLDYLQNISDITAANGVKMRLLGSQPERKRWLKYKLYYRIPGRIRVFLYYLYRMYVCGGFLDGVPGFYFHFFQAYWYRMLVDAKLYEANSKKGSGC